MPYQLKKHPTKKGRWVVTKKDGKMVAGQKTSLSRQQALKAMKLRYHIESGKPLTRAKK